RHDFAARAYVSALRGRPPGVALRFTPGYQARAPERSAHWGCRCPAVAVHRYTTNATEPRCFMFRSLIALSLFALAIPVFAAEPTPAERGYKALTETAFIPAFWSPNSIPNAWKQWDVKEAPTGYDAAFRERYGLHSAPYPNAGLPMGLRKSTLLFSN